MIFGSFFRNLGIILAGLVGFGGLYEFIALLSGPAWPPTFSNLVQGLRDGGHKVLVFIIAMTVVCILAMFGAWLYYHFVFEPRTNN